MLLNFIACVHGCAHTEMVQVGGIRQVARSNPGHIDSGQVVHTHVPLCHQAVYFGTSEQTRRLILADCGRDRFIVCNAGSKLDAGSRLQKCRCDSVSHRAAKG